MPKLLLLEWNSIPMIQTRRKQHYNQTLTFTIFFHHARSMFLVSQLKPNLVFFLINFHHAVESFLNLPYLFLVMFLLTIILVDWKNLLDTSIKPIFFKWVLDQFSFLTCSCKCGMIINQYNPLHHHNRNFPQYVHHLKQDLSTPCIATKKWTKNCIPHHL
jgi:hypothetical protein